MSVGSKIDEVKKNFGDVYVSYIRDLYGVRKGVVILAGRGEKARIGWSLLSTGDVYPKNIRNLKQIPSFEKAYNNGDIDTIVAIADKLLAKLGDCFNYEQYFDKEKSFDIAIERLSIDNYRFDVLTDSFVVPEDIPNDSDLINKLITMQAKILKGIK